MSNPPTPTPPEGDDFDKWLRYGGPVVIGAAALVLFGPFLLMVFRHVSHTLRQIQW